MNFNLNNENDPWEPSLDIDDSETPLTPVSFPLVSTLVEPSPSTLNPYRSKTSPADIKNFLKNRKIDQVVAIVRSCSPNAISDLTVTMKDLSGIIPETIHYKVIGDGGYGKNITVGAALILANVSVFSPTPSMHYLNITMRNVVKVFRKDTIPGSDSG
ncbi:GPCR kinase [Tanacetum coccineum]